MSGDGHSFEAATHSFSGTVFTTPSPPSKVRSLSTFSSVFRMALDALKISSRNANSASGNLPAVTRRYLSALSALRLTGPHR